MNPPEFFDNITRGLKTKDAEFANIKVEPAPKPKRVFIVNNRDLSECKDDIKVEDKLFLNCPTLVNKYLKDDKQKDKEESLQIEDIEGTIEQGKDRKIKEKSKEFLEIKEHNLKSNCESKVLNGDSAEGYGLIQDEIIIEGLYCTFFI